MSVKINLGAWSSVFAVPSKIVDEGLKFSDGVKLKVLLYVLRNSDNEITNEDISRATGVNVTDIPEALDYWVQIVFTAQRLADDEELKILVNEAQSALGKTLSNSDVATLLMLKDTCGLPLDVILMLIQYSISINKANMRSIESIGIKWSDDGVFSVEAADEKIRRANLASKNYSIVKTAFGLSNPGSPTAKQLEYSNKWITEWKFSPDMLREAYERCVDTKGSMKFSYIDGILKRWNSEGIANLNDLAEFEAQKKAPAKKRKTSYDIEEIKKIDTLDFI